MRLLNLLLAAALLGLALLPAVAQAQAPQRSGKWAIDGNPSSPGCSASVDDLSSGATRGTVVLMLVSYQHEFREFIMVVGGESWNFFTTGKRYDIALRFDGSPPLVFSMEALQNSRVMLHGKNLSTLFEKLAGARVLAIGQGERIFATLPIDGGAQAMASLLDCQARHESSARPQAAPPVPAPAPAAQPAPSTSSARRVWKSLGNWTVSSSGGYDSCSLDNLARGGDTGLELDWLQDKFLMIARNPAWTDFTADRTYDVTLRFHPGGAHQTRSRAARLGSVPVFGWSSLGQAFFDDFARAERLTVEHQGSVIGSVDLAGSTAALREKEACDRAWAKKPLPPLLPPASPNAPPPPALRPPSETNPMR